MNFELSPLGILIAAAWALALPLDSALTIFIALLIFCARSVPVSLLLLLSLNLIAFFQATIGGKKSGNGITQKKFAMSFFGIFIALFGASFTGQLVSNPLIFFGLLASLSGGFNLIFFNRHYEQLTLKAYLRSALIPTLVAINILLKIKAEMKADYTQMWDAGLLILGLFSFIYSSFFMLARDRLKAKLIYLSQAWVGLLLFLCVIDFENLNALSFAAISILCITAPVLIHSAWQLGDRYFAFSKMTLLGLPGMIGLTSLYLAIKMTIGLNVMWLGLLGFGYILIAISFIGARPSEIQTNARIKIRFWMMTAVQLISGVGLYLWEKGGLQ